MIHLIAAALLLALTTEECPVFVESGAEGLRNTDLVHAQSYARCMSIPHVPLESELKARAAQCARSLPSKKGAALKDAIDWVDHVSANVSGCETRLDFKWKQ
jgi:plasmid stability protein